MGKRRNCWDIKGCDRGPAGGESRRDPCPAALHQESTGINGGEYAGRYCWRIAGTFCSDRVQGDFAQKVNDCGNCEVFKEILRQEGKNFII